MNTHNLPGALVWIPRPALLAFGLCVACLALLVAAAGASGAGTYPVAASVSPVLKSVKGTNGYQAAVSAYSGSGGKGTVTVTLRNRWFMASHTVKGTAGKKIKANFGKLGSVNLAFHATGKKHAVPMRGCTGDQSYWTPGVFKGRFTFKGQHGYTKVSTTTLKGRYHQDGAQTCPYPVIPPPKSMILGTVMPSGPGSNWIMGFQKDIGHGPASYNFNTGGRLGSVTINYLVSVAGARSTFSNNNALTAATIKPPSPFTGKAVMHGTQGVTHPSGNLKVKLPTGKSYALTGKTVGWSLFQV